MYKVQSIIFDKQKFSLHLSKEWLKKHGYKNKGLDDSGDFFRFRQFNPTSLKKQGYHLFRNKKLGKSGVELIIAYNECKCGGRILNEDLHHFIHSSYSKGKDYKNWKLDHELSDASVQVYFNGQDAVVVHRGSQDLQDWKENVMDILNIKSKQPRLEHSRDIQKKAEEKYGANNVITIGHSKGAKSAEEVGQNSREIYTLNKPVFPQDILSGKKVPEKQTDIRTTLDPVSILRPFQRGSKIQNILSKTLNPLTEHSFYGDVLKRVNPAKWWGKGIQKKDVLKNYQDVLTHLTSHIADPNEPIDPRDYQQSKKIINAIQKVKTGKGSCIKSGGANDQEEEPEYYHPEVPEPHFPNRIKIKNKEQFNNAMNNLYHLIRSRSDDINLIVEIFDDLIDYTEIHSNIHIVDLTKFINLLKYVYKRVSNNNVKDRAKDILREYGMELDGGGAGASIPINQFNRLYQELEEVLREHHTYNAVNVTRVQLNIVRILREITELPTLTNENINSTIQLIDTIIERPLLELSFKRRLETLKRILISAIHLQGGGSGASVANNGFEQFFNHLENLYRRINSPNQLQDERRIIEWMGQVLFIVPTPQQMNRLIDFIDRMLSDVNISIITKDTLIRIRRELRPISGGGSGIITNRWNNTESQLREILENISNRPPQSITNNESQNIVRLFNRLNALIVEIRQPYNNIPIPRNIRHEISQKHRVVLHLYNEYIRDNPRYAEHQQEFEPIRVIINMYENQPHHLTPRDDEEEPNVSGRGREFGLSFI